MRMRRGLRKHHFAAAEVYFATGNSASDVAERLKACHPDQIIWYRPGELSQKIAERLGDIGVPMIGVSDGDRTPIRCHYQISRGSAIAALMREWKKEAIACVVVASGAKNPAADTGGIESILDDAHLAVKYVKLGLRSIDAFVRSLGGSPKCGIILVHSAASLLAIRAPEALARLAACRRVAFVDGPVSTPFTKLSNVLVDMVTVDWVIAARRIVNDLLTRKVRDHERPVVFEAIALSRVPLSGHAERF